MPKFFANLFNIQSTKPRTFQGLDGPSIEATGGGSANKGETAEIYGAPGVIGRPGKNTKGLRIRLGKIDIIVAVYNYGITPPTNPGETKVYSTDADGAEQGKHDLKNDGTHIFNDGTLEAARKTDTTKLTMSGADIAALAASLLTTAAFVPTGTPPVPGTPVVFTGGEITDGTSEVLLP